MVSTQSMERMSEVDQMALSLSLQREMVEMKRKNKSRERTSRRCMLSA